MDSNIFKEIKSKLDIIEVAEYYGLELDKHDKCNCPFHAEKTSSFSISRKKQMFHCFGCNVGGDVISLTAKLFDLSSIRAAERLNSDFHLGLNMKPHKSTATERQEQAVRNQRKAISKIWETWKDSAIKNVIEYIKLLERWQKQYEPKDINEEYNPYFVESCQEIGFTEYLYDCMIQADEKAWQELYRTNKNEIQAIERRVQIYEQYNR
ncbi:MAG: hypothetical protein IIT46_16260 [Lachnospiraceae bacterium]|nr:hypothetical protein [Lachnospiraceae bacterium]